MPLRAIARLIQTMLYAQRFFPYYVYNILGGIEEDGECLLLQGVCVANLVAGARPNRETTALPVPWMRYRCAPVERVPHTAISSRGKGPRVP